LDDHTNQVDAELLEEKFKELFQFKVLLLGAGESGKSTIVKQLRLIHNKKPTKADLMRVGDSLHQNTIECMKALLEAAHKFEYPLTPEDEKTAEAITQIQGEGLSSEGFRIPPELGVAIVQLFNGEAIKKTYARRNEFWLLDSCQYYITHLERFCGTDFLPNDDDSVMARIRTTGIVVSELEQKIAEPKEGEPDTLLFKVVDVGGQRNERKKWIHCFDDVKAIVFIESLAAYNQVLFEDGSKNRMIESLELFKDISNRPAFKDTPLFLFLNKKDLFETMCLETDLKVCFPEYEGGKNVQNALAFVEKKFRDQLPTGKQVAVSVVASVVRRELKAAFDDVKRALFELNRPKIDAEKAKIKKSQDGIAKRGKGSAPSAAPSSMAESSKPIMADSGARRRDEACCFCLDSDVR